MSAPRPELSVLIASRDRRELLRRCLESLAAQTLAPDRLEVVVALDGSSDGSAEMTEALEAPFALRALRLPGRGKSTALNRALAEARGDVCLFLDDDLVAGPGLAQAHLDAHRAGRVLAIGRLVQAPPRGRDPVAEESARAWNERYEQLAVAGVDWADCYGANFSAPAEALREAGGFDTELPAIEDIEIGYRLWRAGCEPRYLPGAEALHDDDKPGRRVLADRERLGAVAAQMAAAEPPMRARLLGWFTDTTPREVTLRRALLALRVPGPALAAAARALPAGAPRRLWLGFVFRYAFWRGARSALGRGEWRATTRGVPVLMYHAFTAGGRGSRFVMPARSFSRQLRLLRALRYRPVGLEELASVLAEGTELPARTVVITIDDGYRDNHDVALPLLRRHRAAATVFLVSSRIGGESDWTAAGEVAGRPLLGAGEIARMREEGVRFGAHTRAHPSLPDLPAEAVEDEVGGSRRELAGLLGAPPSSFAYPYGRFDRRALEAVRHAGFAAACTAAGRAARPGDDPLLVPRIEVRGTDSTRTFLRKLWFGDTA